MVICGIICWSKKQEYQAPDYDLGLFSFVMAETILCDDRY
jgi:hypothetical protein